YTIYLISCSFIWLKCHGMLLYAFTNDMNDTSKNPVNFPSVLSNVSQRFPKRTSPKDVCKGFVLSATSTEGGQFLEYPTQRNIDLLRLHCNTLSWLDRRQFPERFCAHFEGTESSTSRRRSRISLLGNCRCDNGHLSRESESEDSETDASSSSNSIYFRIGLYFQSC
ncbi:hypothetical protein L9F63_002186, partial [Diploptera punctata]